MTHKIIRSPSLLDPSPIESALMDISAPTKSLIRNTAPTLLTALALPPPFNIIAAAVVSGVMEKYLPLDASHTQPEISQETPAPQDTAIKYQPTPTQIIQAIENNANDPQIILDLRRAEIELKKYETDAGIRFAELELDNVKDSRKFQRDTGISVRVFDAGIKLVITALAGLVIVIVGSLSLLFFPEAIPATSANLAIAVFGLIGTAVGFINGIAANVVSFYWGSSQGSKEKSEEIARTVQNLGDGLVKAAANKDASVPQVRSTVGSVQSTAEQLYSQEEPASPAIPAAPSLLAEVLPELKVPHRYVEGGVSWALTLQGISVEGALPSGTAGEPTTVRNIWTRYGELCSQYAKRYGVPVELIVATIATESGGDQNARRAEPQIKDESVGLMQTLVKTARGALGQRDILAEHLLKPELSIEAGTAYIAQQRGTTHFDPPKVAAAYNAGSLRRDRGDANRWRLLCYPTGTGRHIDRFVAFFADCMHVSAEMDWGKQTDVPSFCSLLK